MTKRLSGIRNAVLAMALAPVLTISAMAGGISSSALTGDSNGPVSVDGVKIDNFGVVDGRILRGSQPGKRDYAALAALGVTTVIDLREDSKSESRGLAEAAGLRYVNIRIDGHGEPRDSDVAAFLKTLDETGSEKVYVHCAGGRHRTGSMIAVYRMVRNGWSLDRAYQEMLAYDFYTGGGHGGFKTFVEDYWQRMRSNPSSVPVAYRVPAAGTVLEASEQD